jgi:dTDP-4-dehydrorhamnose 3,5-epimerase
MRALRKRSEVGLISASASDRPRIIATKRWVDHLGWFSETFHEKRLRKAGIGCHFVQGKRSQSKLAGTVRRLHFQLPPAAQAKLVGVLRGRILDIAVDIRNGSPTYGKHVSAELSAENGHQLYVPVGFAHGFCTLEDDVEVMYKVIDYYAPSLDTGLRWDDPHIGFPWPVATSGIIVFEKDTRLPAFEEFFSPVAYDGHPLMFLALQQPA